MKLQKQQEITFIYHAGKHVQMRAFNRWEGICIEKSLFWLHSRDIQCEKFIEDESVSHEPYDSMYPNIY